MLVEVLFEDLNNSLVIDVETHVETVKQVLPFKSKAVVWKHEIYFSTPINISFSEKTLFTALKRVLFIIGLQKKPCAYSTAFHIHIHQ
ncbi:cyclophilin-like family protein [Ignisphaera sp. 4213-co]|uniref:Cyclophilin-like family protein n=1 Tax=Ignisphaera cupida TaxID=3050454 RepID=A0ABD4Z6U1_9CREN|nr:cyclophilin-like family protein [Ignisphaera sp. 4213-co]MDK6028839.1 cyclophilin-like family protein [Ignisphaera sp. 4213-co]